MYNKKVTTKFLSLLIFIFISFQIQSASIPNDIIILNASDATIKSTSGTSKLGIEIMSGLENLAYWSQKGDSAEWYININVSQKYQIIFEAACPNYSANNVAEIRLGNISFLYKVQATSGWADYQNFIVHHELFIEAGQHTLIVSSNLLKQQALMNLRSIILLPVSRKAMLKKILADRIIKNKNRSDAYNEITTGNKFYSAGNYPEALKHYKKALEIDSTYGEAYYKVGRLQYSKLNQPQNAVLFLKKAHNLMNSKTYVYIDLIFAAQKAGLYKLVFQTTDNLIKLYKMKNESTPIWVFTNAAVWSLWASTQRNPILAAKYAHMAAYGNFTDKKLVAFAFKLLISALKDADKIEECFKHIRFFVEHGDNNSYKGRFLDLMATYYLDKFEDEDSYFRILKEAISFHNEAVKQANGLNKVEYAEIEYERSVSLFKSEIYQEAYLGAKKASNAQPDNTGYKNHLANCSLQLGYISLGEKKYDEALHYLNQALKYRQGKADTEKRLIDIGKKRMKLGIINPQYVHKFLGLFIMNSDIRDVLNYQNQNKSYTGKILKKQIRSILLSQKVFVLYLEYLTAGKVTATFNNIFDNNTLLDVRKFGHRQGVNDYGYEADVNAINGDINELLFKNANTYDTRIYFWRAGIFTSYAVGGAIPPAYVPYNLNGSLRGYITAPVEFFGYGDFLLMHEFWHVIENIVPIGIGHAWTPENIGRAQQKYPQWQGKTEWSWYQYHANKTIPIFFNKKAKELGIKKPYRLLSFHNYHPEKLKQFLIDSYFAKIKNFDRTKLKKAFSLYNSAMEKLSSGNKKEALILLNKVIEENPFHYLAYYELGRYAYEKKDYETAYSYYKQSVEICPIIYNLFNFSWNFYHAKNYKHALYFAKKGYKLYKLNAFLHIIIRTLYQMNNPENAEIYIQQQKRFITTQNINNELILQAENAALINSDNQAPGSNIENIYNQLSLGNWGNVKDYVEWKYKIINGGKFKIEIEWACSHNVSGSLMQLNFDNNYTIQFKVKPTDSWVDFRKMILQNIISLPNGFGKLTLKPMRNNGGAFMNIRTIRLRRISE